MIPILYDTNEVNFTSNGLGRLRDCISCTVTEERNGIYECDFEYPVRGAQYDKIKLGRIIGVTHDDMGDVQPFDIVSISKPIDGVVTFHCVHISYRQSYLTVRGSNINTLESAFTLLESAKPTNPFVYWTDKVSAGYMASADGIPRTVRQLLGGVEGSILDAYGGEYEWDKFTVKLWEQRGHTRDFTIRYGVNMLDYIDEMDMQGTYSSCVPYWSSDGTIVVGGRVISQSNTLTKRDECVPLDLTDKFENAPTASQLENLAQSMINNNNTYLPTQNIKVSFIRLQDTEEYSDIESLLQCKLCDTVRVIFPDYGTEGQFKIVKTVWDVLGDRYESMELGTLLTTLAEALGITNGLGGGGAGGGGGGGVLDFYPVGSYYETSDSTFNPNATWGGTWVLEAEGLVHIGAGSNYTVGDTGGEATHKLTVTEMPSHSHNVVSQGYNVTLVGNSPASGAVSAWFYGSGGGSQTGSKGGSSAHNNMQPYIVVNRWHRTA